MNQKTVGLTLRAVFLALALILAAGPALPPLDGVAYAQSGPSLTAVIAPGGASVTVSWTEVEDADGYDLYRQLDGSGSWTGPISGVTGTSHSDPVSGLTGGASYFYIVRSTENGTKGAWSNTARVTIPGGTAAPTGKPALTGAADGLTAANLSWTAVSGATSYDLRRWNATTSSWDAIGGTLDGTSYNDTGLTAGTTYYYVIRAVNAGGNGPWSSEGGTGYTSVALPAATTVPVLSFTHPSRERVVLTWTQVADGAQYDLQRMTDVTGDGVTDVAWARLPSSGLLTAATYTDEAATYVSGSTSTKYKYRVQAVIDGDHGDYSNEVTVTIPATGVRPPVPGAFTASAASATSVTVSWGTVPAAASYELRFKTGTGDYGNPISTTKTTYTHSGRSAGTQYTYQVRSKNVNGYSDWSAEKSATTPATTTGSGLGTPGNLRAVEASTTANNVKTAKVRVTWSSVSSANSYEIRIWNNSNNWVTVPLGTDTAARKKTVDDRSLTLMGEAVTGVTISSDTTYYFVIRARKMAAPEGGTIHDDGATEVETSDWSSPVSVKVAALAPGAPTALTAESRSESSIWLTWTQPPAGGDGATATGTATSYTIEWRRGTSQAKQSMTVTGRTNYLHTGLSSNTEYFYRVRANNNSGKSMSGWWPNENSGTASIPTNCTDEDTTNNAGCDTTEILAKTAARALQPPSGIKAEAMSTTSIKLSWNKVAGATGYEIQRWDTEPDPDAWVTLDANGDSVAGNATTKTTFTHTNLTATASGTTQYYIIRTLSGGGSASQWSGVVTGMTKSNISTDVKPVLTLLPTGQTTVRLAWSIPDTIVGATGYEVQYALGATTTAQFDDPQRTKTTVSLGVSPMYYVHSGLQTGTRYTYRMRATLPNKVNSGWSDLKQVMTRPAKPDLTATATISTSITLTWNAITFITDPATLTANKLDAIADYQIQRRASTGTATERAWANVTEGFTDGSCATKCTLVDTGRSGGVTYFYRIRVKLDDTENEVTNAPGVTSYWDTARARTPAN